MCERIPISAQKGVHRDKAHWPPCQFPSIEHLIAFVLCRVLFLFYDQTGQNRVFPYIPNFFRTFRQSACMVIDAGGVAEALKACGIIIDAGSVAANLPRVYIHQEKNCLQQTCWVYEVSSSKARSWLAGARSGNTARHLVGGRNTEHITNTHHGSELFLLRGTYVHRGRRTR